MNNVVVDDIVRLHEFGLERMDEDHAILGFAARAEARLTRWFDYARGALLFVMSPEDPESGFFWIYDRGRQQFLQLGLPVPGRFGGFREDECDPLCRTFGLTELARNPKRLTSLHH